MPFNPEQGVENAESSLNRAFWALPFLVLSAIAVQYMDATPIAPDFESVLKTGIIEWNSGSAPIVEKFYGVEILDTIWKPIVVAFSQWNLGFDVPGAWQMFTFLTDLGVLYSIYLIESFRRANALTLMQL
jgi:hypothetical protein